MSRRKQARPRALKTEDPPAADGDEPRYKCGGCGTSLDDLSSFLEHLNQECMGGSNGGIGTPSSLRSSDTPDDQSLSLSPTSCPTPSDPDADLSYTIGVTENTPYGCQFCDKAFPRLSYLKRHEQVHSDQMPFKCEYCQRLFKHKRSRDRHVKLHTGDRKYRCPHCEAAFSRSDHLKIHMKTHDHAKPYQCTACNRGYNTAAALSSHMQNHKKEALEGHALPPRCGKCSAVFLTALELQNHIETCGGQSPPPDGVIQCAFCPQLFPSSDTLRQHLNHLHPEARAGDDPSEFLPLDGAQRYKGRIPSADDDRFGKEEKTPGSSSTEVVAEVSSRSSPASSPTFDCEYCSQTFSSVHVLQRHTLTTHSFTDVLSGGREESHRARLVRPADQNGEEPTKSPRLVKSSTVFNGSGPRYPDTLLCSQCGAAFPDFESFRTHLKSHLDSGLGQTFTCAECEGEFPSEEQLDSHAASHFLSTSTEYGCQSCLKLFAKPDELQKHLMDIHAHHLYRCALCKEMFDSKVTIQVHFAVKHSNECPLYKCTGCLTVFRSQDEFRAHVKLVHLAKLQPFRCLLCDRCFPSELQLQYHVTSHKKQFRCSLCDEAFHVEFLLDRHVQTSHTDRLGAEVAPQNLSLKPSSVAGPQPDMSKKDARCDICDVVFPSDGLLVVHRRQAHNLRPLGPQKAAGLSLLCAYCHEACKSRTELENHMKVHTASPSKHKCNICDELCPSAATLAEHKLTHCKVLAGSTCVSCRLPLATEDQYYAHVQQHNSHGLPLPCVVCRQTLMSEIEVQVHARFHLQHSDTIHGCCVCGQKLDTGHLIITGKQESGGHTYMCKDCFHSKGDELRCPDCGVKFEAAGELDQHRACHRKTYQCIKCQMSFDSEADIQAHVTSHVLQEGTHHDCKLCHLVVDSPAKLQCHLIEHTFEGCSSFTCYMCSAVFTGPHLLQQHMLEHGLSSRPYDCSSCHQRFFFRAELENHAFLHSDEDGGPSEPHRARLPEGQQQDEEVVDQRSFHCPECDKVFQSLTSLQGHLRGHGKGARFQCPDCPKEFSLARNLALHRRSHSSDRPYECPVCRKTFSRKETRKVHLKSHTGAKPFVCPHCGKGFSRKGHVKEHMRTHASSTSHPCELCPDTFPDSQQLRRHMADAHQKHYDHNCSVCGDVFQHARGLELHVRKAHDCRVTSSPGATSHGSSSADSKDVSDSSDCSSSPIPFADNNNLVPPPEVAA